MWEQQLLFILCGLLLVVFAALLAARGRSLGRRLLRWVYDKRTGEFEVRDDWELWRDFIKRLDISSSELVLDLGTRTGHLPRLIAQQSGFRGTATGVDWADEMIEEAKRQARLEGTTQRACFVCADISQPLPFPDNAFTMVLCVTGVLEGIHTPSRLLDDISRVLRRNGRVVFTCALHHLKPSSVDSGQWFSEHLPEYGFTSPRIVPWTAAHNLVVARLKTKASTCRPKMQQTCVKGTC